VPALRRAVVPLELAFDVDAVRELAQAQRQLAEAQAAFERVLPRAAEAFERAPR
jgi:hypothetical protein